MNNSISKLQNMQDIEKLRLSKNTSITLYRKELNKMDFLDLKKEMNRYLVTNNKLTTNKSKTC